MSSCDARGKCQKARCLLQGRPRAASRRWRWRSPRRLGGAIINADSMQVYRDLRIITARPSRPKRRARRTGFTAMSMRRRTIRSAAGARDARAAIRDAAAKGLRADPRRRHRALFQGADAGAFGGPADPAGNPQRDAARGSTPRVRRRCMPSLRGAIRRAQRASATATVCGSAVRWRCWRRPDARWRTGTSDGMPPVLDPDDAVKVFLSARSRRALSPHRRAV